MLLLDWERCRLHQKWGVPSEQLKPCGESGRWEEKGLRNRPEGAPTFPDLAERNEFIRKPEKE